MQRFDAPESPESSSSESSGSSYDDSNEPEYSTSGSESSSSQGRVQRSELLLTQLAAFAEGEPQDDSMAAEQGRSKDRIKQVLKKSCSCKKDCMRKVSLKAVLATVLMFWSLSKTAQDTLLWSMQSSMTIGEDQDQSSDSEDESLPVKGDRSRTPRRVLHHWYLQGVSILILDIVFSFSPVCTKFFASFVFQSFLEVCRFAGMLSSASWESVVGAWCALGDPSRVKTCANSAFWLQTCFALNKFHYVRS